MRANQPFSAWVESPEPLVRELWCSFEPDDALQREADEVMATFLRDIKAALDACVLATANIVCRPIGLVDPEVHRMPLVAAPSEFDSLTAQERLRVCAPTRSVHFGYSSRSPNDWRSRSLRGRSPGTWHISQPGLRR
jgi:hypothetical protein